MKSNEFIPTVTAELPAFAPAVEELAARLSGQPIRPGDAAYEHACRLWNGRIDKYPALIARCRTAQDVVLAVNFARDHNLTVAIRGGAHNTNGFASINNGLVIDLIARAEQMTSPFLLPPEPEYQAGCESLAL